jgi:hypothetical protein
MKNMGWAVLFLVSGCATTGGQDMTPEQLKALVADKNFSAVCSTVTGLWGSGKFVYVNVDRTVVANGAISVDANCLVTMSNSAGLVTLRGQATEIHLPITITPQVVR